ncbi:cytochrome P450 27C1-like isoform X2 [Pomacea canaliculata]|nr:cytochrome P450 27C1-like isoform X2 [Pomacea canaliculata]XP_025098492.1 cytochrome P450 27C1-like isoform X2 [Pomacea canaliculata]
MMCLHKNCLQISSRALPCIRWTSNSSTSASIDASPRPFKEIPGPGGLARLPGIGPAFLFKPFTDVPSGRFDLVARSLHDQYGPLVRLQLLGPSVLVGNLQDMETVYRNEGRYPERYQFGLMQHYFHTRKKETLSMIDGEKWLSLRMRIQPKFMRTNATLQYVGQQDCVAADLVKHLGKKELTPEAQQDIIFRYVLESIGVFAFNKRLGSLDEDTMFDENKRKFPETIRLLFKTLANHPVLPLYRLFPTPAFKTVAKCMDFLIGESVKHMQQAFKEVEKQQAAGNLTDDKPNLITSLLMSDDVTEQEVIMSMSEIFNGGTDTTTKTLYVFLYNLARFPEKQKLLAEEISRVLGNSQTITAQQLAQLTYLRACLKESMRLAFPVVPGPMRRAPYDLVLSGYRIPKGTMMLLTCDAWLKNPQNVTSPSDFLPERWLRNVSGKREQPIPTVAFLPFGINTRNCMGRRFAEQIIFLAVAKIIQNFEVSLGEGSDDIQIMYEVFPTTTKAVPFLFKPK